MSEALLGAYLAWLEPQVGVDRQPRRYMQLMQLLVAKEFVPVVPYDDNRVVDGLDVRREFCAEQGCEVDDLGPCSVLEVLVALSRRLAFNAGGDAAGWAWQLLCNLELEKFWDRISRQKAILIEEILDALVWRTYSPDGQGGFFPLDHAQDDQTRLELWYQMAAYVNELHPEY